MPENRKKLLYKLAKAYYIDQLTQAEIGKRFGLSRIKVSRLLRQARVEGVVKITITPQQESNADLEREIEAKYGIDEAVVFSPSANDDDVIFREIGPPAADCLFHCLQGSEILGLSWGSTLHSSVEALSTQNWPEMTIVQIIGGLGQPDAETYGADLMSRIAQAFGAKPRLLSAPGIVKNKSIRDALYDDPQIADTLALAAKSDVAVVGIGKPTPNSSIIKSGIFTDQELEELRGLGAVGDIALNFFNEDGRLIDHAIHDRVIGLTLDQIKAIPRVIGVAGGLEKFDVIRAVLRGKLVDVIVTDKYVANKLVEES
jgi:DNA-binding transcriptional regulator LsrR (DeoR family)